MSPRPTPGIGGTEERRWFVGIIVTIAMAGFGAAALGYRWMGQIETQVSQIGESSARVETELKRRIDGLETRQTATEMSSARVDQRLLSIEAGQQRQELRLERILELLTTSPHAPTDRFRAQ